MSRATRITDNYSLLNNLHRLMWEASDAIMAVYEADDFGETLKSDQSPVTQADLAAHHSGTRTRSSTGCTPGTRGRLRKSYGRCLKTTKSFWTASRSSASQSESPGGRTGSR